MTVLIAPNGVTVNASELDTPILLAAGYTRADEKPAPQPKQTRKRAKKVTTDEPTD